MIRLGTKTDNIRAKITANCKTSDIETASRHQRNSHKTTKTKVQGPAAWVDPEFCKTDSNELFYHAKNRELFFPLFLEP